MNPDSITHSHHYINKADWIKFGYRKIRDARIYRSLSTYFSDIMIQDGKKNICGGFMKLWKVDNYSLFYEHLGIDILTQLQRMDWNQPIKGMIKHPKFTIFVLSLVGPMLKLINKIHYKVSQL